MGKLKVNEAGLLFDPGPRPRRRPWRGSLALVPYLPGCPQCAWPTSRRATIQAPLFYHGGFGEAQHDSIEVCPVCCWAGRFVRAAINPRRVA